MNPGLMKGSSGFVAPKARTEVSLRPSITTYAYPWPGMFACTLKFIFLTALSESIKLREEIGSIPSSSNVQPRNQKAFHRLAADRSGFLRRP